MHLLVVDDDTGVLDLLRRYFSGQGFEVSVAANGAEMRDALARSTVDLVLLDLGLPGEDGFELTRQLRKRWNGALIIITGRGESVDRVVGLELGADDYVTKPFDLRELLARVRSVLRRAPRMPRPGKRPTTLHSSSAISSSFPTRAPSAPTTERRLHSPRASTTCCACSSSTPTACFRATT
jgi:DNA-binding response OmpR family regulator